MLAFERDGDSEMVRRLLDAVQPNSIDSLTRMAMRLTWISIPENQRSVEEVRKRLIAIVELALVDLQQDSDGFFRRM